MSDFDSLTEAFTELERRADLALATQPQPDLARGAAAGSGTRWGLVAASAVAVLAVAGGAAVLATAHGSGRSGSTGAAAGGDPTTGNATTGSPTTGNPTTVISQPTAQTFQIPQTADDLAARFRAVLGSSATFTVTDTGAPAQVNVPPASQPANGPATPAQSLPVTPDQGTSNGAFITGQLTAGGVTGGYDLQIFRAANGEKAWCDGGAHCSKQTLAHGSTLAFGREPLLGAPGSITYDIDYVRADGVEFLMHVSNQANPKGESKKLAADPPLSRQQLTQIITSDRW